MNEAEEDDEEEDSGEREKENAAGETKATANAFIPSQEVQSRSSSRRQCW